MNTGKHKPGPDSRKDPLTRRLDAVAAIRRLDTLRLPSLAQRYEEARNAASHNRGADRA